MPRAPDRRRLLAGAALAFTALLLAGGGQGAEPRPVVDTGAAAWRGFVDGDRTAVSVGQRAIVVLRYASLAERVRRAGGKASEAQLRTWAAAALAGQKQIAARLSQEGVQIVPDFVYTRTLNGFAAVLDARALALLERDRDVVGVYPVRVAYPASDATQLLGSDEFGPGAGRRAVPRVPGYDGTGVTIALLDTGVDADAPLPPRPRARGNRHRRPGRPRRRTAASARSGARRASRDADGGAPRRRQRPGGSAGCGTRCVPAPDQGRRVAAERGGRLRRVRPHRPAARRSRARGGSGRGRQHARRRPGRPRRGRGAVRGVLRRAARARGGRRGSARHARGRAGRQRRGRGSRLRQHLRAGRCARRADRRRRRRAAADAHDPDGRQGRPARPPRPGAAARRRRRPRPGADAGTRPAGRRAPRRAPVGPSEPLLRRPWLQPRGRQGRAPGALSCNGRGRPPGGARGRAGCRRRRHGAGRRARPGRADRRAGGGPPGRDRARGSPPDREWGGGHRLARGAGLVGQPRRPPRRALLVARPRVRRRCEA